MSRTFLITGTDTGVGKTVVTAALAAAFIAAGERVHVHKPVQTGVAAGAAGDVAEVERLVPHVSTSEGLRLTEPMAPVPAARIERVRLPSLTRQIEQLPALRGAADVLLVEGAGGLLVQLGGRGETIADLAAEARAPLIVVTRAGLGTLNHTELTLEAIAHRGLRAAGLVIGSWPARPGVIERTNRHHLAGLGVPLLGALPAGADGLAPSEFQRLAPGWFQDLPRAIADPFLGQHDEGHL
ncbi:dethiobiotin synthase [Nostocoides vanveenii]|jgi:dethiobiotin synthetase|uniref:ATP-dependent dethiobiotin synthetase BioD n=1 Tax=Nostocoides vanveenii TaxID=330835 RepID=A0ABN2KEM1_9MICO